MDDVFCKIIRGEVPSHKIYEDDYCLAILDISQVTKGHILVISKKHFDNFLTCDSDIYHKMFDVAQRIGQAQITSLGARGVNILTNCYEASGQTVKHFHIHVIPRYENNDGFILTMRENKEDLNLPSLAEFIRKNVK